MKLYTRFCTLLFGLLFCMLTGCSSTTTLPEISTIATPSPAPNTQALTIPSHIVALAGGTPATATNVQRQEDGSLVYHLTPQEKETLLAELKQTLDSYLEALPTDWPFVQRLSIDTQYQTVTLFAKSTAQYNPTRDNKIGGALFAPIALYRCFAGFETPADFSLTILVVNAQDNTEIAALSYPTPIDSPSDKTGDGDNA